MRLGYDLTIKAATEEADGLRIRGIASTSNPDGLGDVLVAAGAQFKLPMPLLWMHKRGEIVGRVEKAKVSGNEIDFEAFLPFVERAGVLKDRVDHAIDLLKTGLLTDVSVGFKEIPAAIERLKSGGLRFREWIWRELSLVDIGENTDAKILKVRAVADDDSSLPAVVGETKPAAVAATINGATKSMNIREQRTNTHATLVSKSAKLSELMALAGTEGRSLEKTEAEEVDRLTLECKSLEADLARLEDVERIQIAAAKPIEVDNVKAGTATPAELASLARDPYAGRIQTRRNLAKGAAFTRYVMSLCASNGDPLRAMEFAKNRFNDTPEVVDVLKSAVAAATTTDATWAGSLVQYRDMAAEFIDLLRPLTITGQMPAMRRVPFNIRVGRQTAGGSYGWVGQGKAKPVTSLAFDTLTLDFAKISGIIVLTEEVAKFSNPQCEDLCRNDMTQGVSQYMNEQFITPSVAASANVSPASITHNAPTIAASGSDLASFEQDVVGLWRLLPANLSKAGGVFITDESTAAGISMLRTEGGFRAFPEATPNGGTLLGYPLIVSNSVPNDTDDGLLIFAASNEILFAEDTLVIDASREASVEMQSAPSEPTSASTVLVSLWQRNMIGLRVDKFVNYVRRRDDVVAYISGTSYGSGAT